MFEAFAVATIVVIATLGFALAMLDISGKL